MRQRQAVIVSAVRTPTGKFLGGLKDFTAPQLGALVLREAVTRAGLAPDDIDECILGNVVSAGLGQHPARQAALTAGLPAEVPALNVNMVCGSGLRAVMLAAQGIATGDRDIVVAGGMESMSQAPYLLPRAREGFRMGHAQVVDSMIQDGLWCAVDNWHMGMTGEAVAGKYGIGREAQDAYAVRSHQKAAQAQREGAFSAEILPVTIPQKKGPAIVVDRDESVREDTSVEALAKLRPAFDANGTVTAGNAPGVNDGAAALVIAADDVAAERGLTVRARIVAQATSGLEPKWVMMTPVPAIRTVLEKADWTMDSVDLFEINEAFSVQAIAVTGELGIPEDKVNVHGGAVALGHPIGASGARVLVTLLHALERRNLRRGVAALCLGGGNGVALAIERP
ncbi:acetyl-CoA acetyltransferase [Luteitalea sp. TBR-22]|uniref:acetyl-CoA C-acetyltransferase n=1 Tax=Luteitalea sp. TBR-22 TaxID=2802971 RepID=UPI001AF4D51F|nr:acetyl-CoA C-acetyltransferase [Luteitalea sp. TBR-22]BCS33249.1 acetyl-CoA acetyltransferase [Luteitalea sp. TBR-22]